MRKTGARKTRRSELTKQQLVKLAMNKVRGLNKKELRKFVFDTNCCPHENTHPCGMDTVCSDCGDWV